MHDFDDILMGRGERESDSVEAKPRRRNKNTEDALTLLSYCITLLTYELPEGPLRAKIHQLAEKAKTLTRS